MNDLQSALSLHINPAFPINLILVLGAIGLILIIVDVLRTRRIRLWRVVTGAAFILALLNPSLHEEKREPVPGIAAVIVDQSASQSFGERTERTQKALEHVQAQIDGMDEVELRVIHAPQDGALVTRTDLFSSLEKVYADVPISRRAGVIFITDGQVHDIPEAQDIGDQYGPVHVLLSGDKQETDRRIVVTDAPAFGIVGQNITVKFRIVDEGPKVSPQAARVTLQLSTGEERYERVMVGEEHTIRLPVKHAGQNVFELRVEPLEGELTERNNTAALDFQGVRDRLRVLLVSGKPYAGGRTWRDLLTADPSVDLVHFTILREPEKIDATPQNEMSLIAFPFRELFELKLYEFDLIIFDRYRLSRILPDHYFQNIARYVREGGAFLEASGPAYAGEDSIYYTALKNILPGAPTGDVYTQSFVPDVTDAGQAHPVTRSLVHKNPNEEPWGPWLRQVGLRGVNGQVLMSGVNGRPLLVLNRVGEGRVAHIASDHIWLWSRGYEGGGPHAELLRRAVHWLMKEPELDEQALDVRVDGRTLIIRRAGFERSEDVVVMTAPDGTREEITLTPSQGSVLEALKQADQVGIYRFETSDDQIRFAIVGDADPPELRNVLTSANGFSDISKTTGGQIIWLSETQNPRVSLSERAPFGNARTIALKNQNAYTVTGALEKPFIPFWALFIVLVLLAATTWYFEGRKGL